MSRSRKTTKKEKIPNPKQHVSEMKPLESANIEEDVSFAQALGLDEKEEAKEVVQETEAKEHSENHETDDNEDIRQEEKQEKFPKIVLEYRNGRVPDITIENHEKLRTADLKRLPVLTYRHLQKIRRLIVINDKGMQNV